MPGDGGRSEPGGATSGGGLLGEIERDLVSDRPVADILRKCVLFGGHVQSTELRDWATKELRGYDAEDELPDYRVAGSGLFVDA